MNINPEEIAHVASSATTPKSGRTFPDLRWADRIVARAAVGDRVSSIALKWAREALTKKSRQCSPQSDQAEEVIA